MELGADSSLCTAQHCPWVCTETRRESRPALALLEENHAVGMRSKTTVFPRAVLALSLLVLYILSYFKANRTYSGTVK